MHRLTARNHHDNRLAPSVPKVNAGIFMHDIALFDASGRSLTTTGGAILTPDALRPGAGRSIAAGEAGKRAYRREHGRPPLRSPRCRNLPSNGRSRLFEIGRASCRERV